MKATFGILIILLGVTAACNTRQNSKVKPNPSKKYNTVALKKNDSTFLALRDTAQSYMQTFIDSLKRHGNDSVHYRFAVKSDFEEKGVHEHMWSKIFEYRQGRFNGIFVDSAFDIKNIQTGATVAIDSAGVEDWSIYNKSSNKLIGDFSEKYLKSKMKKAD